MAESQLLKKDLFGEIRLCDDGGQSYIVRDCAASSTWIRWLARYLMRREARVLAALEDFDGIPHIAALGRDRLERNYIKGRPIHVARPSDPAWFRDCARLLRRLHTAGVIHNDLAKEPNLLVCDDGSPAFIDFQLAWHAPRRGKLFRVLAYDDLRHLLKHKRSYCSQHMTARERTIVQNPSLPSRLFRWTVKPVYLFVTRRILGWSDREGAANRGDQA
jgi:RIO-like serine/threonine protein kinase